MMEKENVHAKRSKCFNAHPCTKRTLIALPKRSEVQLCRMYTRWPLLCCTRPIQTLQAVYEGEPIRLSTQGKLYQDILQRVETTVRKFWPVIWMFLLAISAHSQLIIIESPEIKIYYHFRPQADGTCLYDVEVALILTMLHSQHKSHKRQTTLEMNSKFLMIVQCGLQISQHLVLCKVKEMH